MYQQYKRDYSLVLGPVRPQKTGYIQSAAEVLSSLGTQDAIFIKDLNIKFKITKNLDNSFKTNKAEISIYNLSDETLAKLQHGIFACQFSCGYLDYDNSTTSWDTLIVGNVYQISTKMEGSDKISTLSIGEEYVVMNNTRITSTLPAGSSVEDVIDHIRKSIGFSKGSYKGNNKNTVLMYGYPLEGSPQLQLSEICKAYGMKWWISDNTLYVDDLISNPKAIRTYTLSKSTGLLETPFFESEKYKVGTEDITSQSGSRLDSELTKSGKPKKFGKFRREGLHIKALLNPHLRPGDLVKIDSDSVSDTNTKNNYYQINEITYSGELRGSDWRIEMICDQVRVYSE